MQLKKTRKPILIIIFLLAAILRFFDIGSNPKAMYGDELTLVYDAYSISRTTQDQKGERFPLVFQLGAARPPGYVYATVPFAAMLGPTALAARLVSVLSGIGIVILLYLLTSELLNKEVALIAALLGAISPWGISLSRAGFEANFALFLILLGIWTFFKGLKKPIWLIISALVFATAIQTYPTGRLTVPLLVILLIQINFKQIKDLAKKTNYLLIPLAVGILLLSFVLSLYLMFSIGERDRFSTISIFQDANAQIASQKVSLERNESGLPKAIGFIFHNKIIEITGVFVKNYLEHFTLEFLFLNGDGNPRHNPAGMGQFYWVSLLLIIIGVVNLLQTNKKLLLFLSGSVLLAPVAASLVGGAHALRSSFMLPPLIILSAWGMWQMFNLKGLSQGVKRYLVLILLLTGLVQFVFLIERVYVMAPNAYASFWSFDAKQVALLAYDHKANFDSVVLSNDISNMEYAYPAYNRIDPRIVIKQNQSKTKMGQYLFFKYDNVYIGSLGRGDIVNFLDSLPGSYLYIGPSEDASDAKVSQVAKKIVGSSQLIKIEKSGVK